MNVNDGALSALVDGLIKTTQYIIDHANYNKGLTGRVVANLGDNLYSVRINDQIYTAKSRFNLNENEIVKIIKWNNSNELYIIY